MPVNVRNLNADTAGRPRVRKDAGVDGSRNPRRRPGGRSARVQDAVAQAALTQLLDVGYQGLTIRGVAQAAGVAETTVYRRWPTINHLTAAALLKLTETDNPLPDTGTLDGDLRALLTQIVALLNRPEVLRVVRSAAAIDHDGDGSVRTGKSAFFDARFTDARLIVERAIGRGEIASNTDAHLLIEALVAPSYMRALLENRPLDEDLVDSSVHIVLGALQSVGIPKRADSP
ncbi:TetR/AcrR family transcriptional regulator [Mycolicibacterium obuense]|uniref:Bacterial regulatory protein, tetR family n=1 Tax=Mycolicibacterium obuense TaxID=1807 RepID=A0A0J6YL86_9MYCO|nr:TetR/AcrR family transcriptional regulator [Mycolicibacterium obuense]KMO73511.1 Bacterial regulatory protein, tetR family [Mycolicibacterium obuense]